MMCMNRFQFLLVLVSGITLLGATASARAQDQYTLSAPLLFIPEDGNATSLIRLDSSLGSDLQAFALGVCHNSSVAEVLSVVQGADVLALNGGAGPDYWLAELQISSYTAAAIVSFQGLDVLFPDPGLDIVECEYHAIGAIGDESPVQFCSVGPLTVQVVSSGVPYLPDLESGSIRIADPDATVYRVVGSGRIIAPGGDYTAAVEMDNEDIVEGFQFAVTHDANSMSVTSIDPGAATAAAGGGSGPDSFLVDIDPVQGVFTVNCVVSTSPLDSIPIGTGQAIVDMEYSVEPTAGPLCSLAEIAVKDEGGDPPVPALATIGGVPQPASVDLPLLVEVGAQVLTTPSGGYTLRAGNAFGVPGTSVTVPVHLDNEGPVAGFAFGVVHDEDFMSFDGASVGATTAALNCGDGPDFFVSTQVPGGCTIGCVFTLDDTGDSSLPPSGDHHIVDLHYSVMSSPSDSSSVDFVGTLGTPPVLVELSSDTGEFIDPTTISGSVGPGAAFSRGDCNDDAQFNIGDAVFLLGVLFSTPDTPNCVDACDANDDGAFDISDGIKILSVLFVPGTTPIPAPVLCDVDPTADALDCAGSSSCP